ncbi:MAG: glycosyltransferase [Microbacterium hominis]|nr:glycosyltransferase [Microbacterium hominis]
MLERVRSRRAGHTNSSMVARSRLLSALKLAYYRLFATAYTASLRCADVIWVNSSWTRAHVESLVNGASGSKGGRRRKRIRLLYPPCDTTHLAQFPLETRYRIPPSQESITILSLAQFRPEKEHPTQLRAFAQLLLSPPSSQSGVTAAAKIPRDKLRLVLAGSVRGPVDADRVEALRRLATELGIAEQVDFVVNESYDVICQLMEKATIGLHTMVDEHFGITLVEFQVRGLRFSQHDRYRRLGGRLTGSLCWIFRLPASSLLHMLRLGH